MPKSWLYTPSIDPVKAILMHAYFARLLLSSQYFLHCTFVTRCEHLLSIDHVQKLLYHQVDAGIGGRRSLHAPPFFVSHNEKGFKGKFFPPGSEAECCILFFAQFLTINICHFFQLMRCLPSQSLPHKTMKRFVCFFSQVTVADV